MPVDGTTEEARSVANRAIELERNKRFFEAFRAYVSATQLFLEAARASPETLGSDARRMASRCLERAERLRESHKLANDPCDTWEIWTQDPSLSDFARIDLHVEASPALSPLQIQQGAKLRQASPAIPIMCRDVVLRAGDIEQGSVSDCSLITAIEIATEHNARWHTRLAFEALFPQLNSMPCRSPTGVYMVKLYLHGQARCITINDALPCTLTGELLCSKPRHNIQLWPALLEKAFLVAKRSSYAFNGSDACMDLYALTGWIPEHIPLHEVSFQCEKTWTRLFTAWKLGRCLLALGTGSSPETTSALVPLHCYGIIELREHQHKRTVSIVNPWKRHDAPQHVKDMAWEEVCCYFDTLLVNWDPALYPHQRQVTGMWDATSDSAVRLDEFRAAQTDQYHISVSQEMSTPILLHLERHDLSGTYEEQEYMALHVFPCNKAQRRAQVEFDGLMGMYVNVPHSLLALHASGPMQYTLAVSRHGSALYPMPYTLTVYATSLVDLAVLPPTMPNRSIVHGSWRPSPNRGVPELWYQPQYRLTVHEGTLLPRVELVVMTSLSTCVAAVLLTSGKRVLCWEEASVVAHTGTLSRGIARSDVQVLQPGAYTLVLLTSCSHDETATSSTTSAAASFSVIVESNVRVSVDILPMLGAGMYRRSAHATTLPHAWQVYVPRAMPLLICAVTDAPDHVNEPATMTIRLEKHSSSLCEAESKSRTNYAVLHSQTLAPDMYTLSIDGILKTHISSLDVDVFGSQPVSLTDCDIAPHVRIHSSS